MLVEELRRMGVPQVEIDEQYGYVYAKILSNRPDGEKVPVLGFIAHMDTSPEVSGADVKPQIIRQYDGKDIVLNKDKNIVLSVEEFPELVQYTGQTLITTDGTTLLGADDKAGVAEIMTMAEQLCSHPEIVHGDIAIAFTPMKKWAAAWTILMWGGSVQTMPILLTAGRSASWNMRTSMRRRQ